jgi:microcin C transport system permease protein
MKPFFTLSPLARKRLRNFMHIRRAVVALALLGVLFLLSLFSELICNSRPLYLRYEGRSFFPFLRSHTMRDLNGGKGDAQPVDWKRFTASAAFVSNAANRAVWAPVPFSPGEVVDASTLSGYRTVRVFVVPETHVGRLDLLRDGRIIQPVACEPFFANGPIEGRELAKEWHLTEPLKQAIAARLAGKAASSASFEIEAFGKAKAIVSLPAVEARKNPRSVRLMFRQTEQLDAPFLLRYRRASNGQVALQTRRTPEIPSATRAEIEKLALSCFDSPIAPATVQWKPGRTAEVVCSLTQIAWPFPPVHGHWMGIDSAGRDVFSRVLYGMRIALSFGIALALWAMFFGVLIGSIQGYFGGLVDITGQRLTEIWSALPFLYVMIFIGSALGRSFLLLLICYGLFNWISISYYMRAEFLRLRQRTFVEAARCQSLSPLRIIFVHILPNALTPLITLFPFNLMGAIGSLAALDFLGFGLPPMTPSWGELLNQAQQFRWAWWLILFPSLALFCVMFLAVLVGEGLRDAFDPRQQSRME